MSEANSPTSPLSPTSPSALSPSQPPLYSRRSSKSSLSLDLSSLPPLTQPTPPTNTLLITNLNDVDVFRPDNLQTIRELIAQTAVPVTWAPLKSFRRIVVSFVDEQAAVRVRSIWDGEAVMGERCRVYFGQHTPLHLLTDKDRHLELPDAGKLFFISPPPSPPHGWEMRLEDAPNKQVHAEDLAEALAKLHHNSDPMAAMNMGMDPQQQQQQQQSPISPVEGATSITINTNTNTSTSSDPRHMRTRSRSSTLIYKPQEHGGSPALPAISVDDMTDEPIEVSPISEGPIKAHTTRPPVELLNE